MPADQDHAGVPGKLVEPPEHHGEWMAERTGDHPALLALLVIRARVDEEGALLPGGEGLLWRQPGQPGPGLAQERVDRPRPHEGRMYPHLRRSRINAAT